jgi:hypothetical protein
VLQLRHFLNQLARHFLAVAIQHPHVVEIEQCVFDTGEAGAATAFDDDDVLGLAGNI